MTVESRQVLLVEDDADMRTATAQALELGGYDPTAVSSAPEALALLEHSFPGVIVTDILMPGMTGLQLFERVRALDPDLPVILVTGHTDVDLAVAAMKNGAYDFISKPFASDRLLEAVRRAMEKRALVLENRRLREAMAAGSDDALIGEASAIRRLRETIRQIADADVGVLVEGETGSGKEVVAELLHRWSRRRDRHFVAVNCGAPPETMIESELFGHEAGAFTGAQKRRIGQIEHSSGGTLFLDEIESMPPSLQVRLLRVLETRQITPLGTNEVRKLNLRVVAATKTDLSDASTRGKFRSDLYFRLNEVTLKIPPLRERREDIPLLFGVFLQRAASRLGQPVPELTSAAKTHLDTHDWPGNVRELLHFATQFVLGLVPGAGPDAAPSLPSTAALSLAERVDRFEAELIRAALRDAEGDVRRAIEILQIPRKTFYDKLKRHGISPSEFKPPKGGVMRHTERMFRPLGSPSKSSR